MLFYRTPGLGNTAVHSCSQLCGDGFNISADLNHHMRVSIVTRLAVHRYIPNKHTYITKHSRVSNTTE